MHRIAIIAMVFIQVLAFTGTACGAASRPASKKEYAVKVGFIYNFMKFTEWPSESVEEGSGSDRSDGKGPMIIGIIGKDPFGRSFEVLKQKRVRDRRIVQRRFKGLKDVKQSTEQLEAIKQCHVLFVCASQEKAFKGITDLVKGHAVLSVGETSGFLEAGGIINISPEGKKFRFEVNLIAANRSKLKISSKLLSLAKRVIKEAPAEDSAQ